MKRSIYAILTTIMVCTSASATTVLFDFNSAPLHVHYKCVST